MPLRLLVLLCLLALPAGLAAQGSHTINSTIISSGQARLYRYFVDHGATAQSLDLTITLTAALTAGLKLTLFDIDEKSVMGSQDEATASQPTPNFPTNLVLTSPSRSGVHPYLLIVQTLTAGTSDYSGTVGVTAGSITYGGTTTGNRVVSGLFTPFGLYAAFNADIVTQSNFTTRLEVDYGATPQAVTFAFQGIGSALTEIRIYDETGADIQLGTLVAAPSGNLDTSAFVTTGSYSGIVKFRIEVEGTGSAGQAFWATWLPGTVTVVGASGDGVSTPTGSSGDGGGCAAGNPLLPLGAIAALMMFAVFRRKKVRRSVF